MCLPPASPPPQVQQQAEVTDYVRNRPRRQVSVLPSVWARSVPIPHLQELVVVAHHSLPHRSAACTSPASTGGCATSHPATPPADFFPYRCALYLQVGRRTHMGDTTESTDLTELSEFVGPAGTGAANAQVGLRGRGTSAMAG